MTTIRVTSRNAAGVAVPGARVVVRLVAGPRPTDPGYFTTGDYSITSESKTVTGSTGVKTLDLPPTDGFSPDGCFYQISTVIGADVAKRTIIVPDTGDYDWGDPDIALIDPASPDASHGLPAGGTDGQVLTKVGTTPYSAGWEDAASAAVGVGEWEPLLPLGSTFSGAGWYDPSEFIDGAGLRWRHARGQIEVQGRAIYLDGSGSPAVPAGGAAIATLPTEAQPADPAPLVAWETPADLTDITTVAARVDADGSIHAAPVTTFAVTLLASTLFDPTTP